MSAGGNDVKGSWVCGCDSDFEGGPFPGPGSVVRGENVLSNVLPMGIPSSR
jgi:hypothetical protein